MTYQELVKKIKSESPNLTDEELALSIYEALSNERDRAFFEGQKQIIENIKIFIQLWEENAN